MIRVKLAAVPRIIAPRDRTLQASKLIDLWGKEVGEPCFFLGGGGDFSVPFVVFLYGCVLELSAKHIFSIQKLALLVISSLDDLLPRFFLLSSSATRMVSFSRSRASSGCSGAPKHLVHHMNKFLTFHTQKRVVIHPVVLA